MKKVCINPANDDMKLMAETLKLRNDFINLGFSTRASFINIVKEYNEKYKDYHNAVNLERWWVFRYKDASLNADLDIIINKLRYE